MTEPRKATATPDTGLPPGDRAPRGDSAAGAPVTTVKNIQAVAALERDNLRTRSALERLTGLVAAAAARPGFVVLHIGWFVLWVTLNTVLGRAFDPYPFSLLTLLVALEAIVLTGFVLIAQGHMTQVADSRAHLDLQVNLLAEQELTAILKVVCLIAEKTGVDVTSCDPNIQQLLHRTDVKVLADELTRELAGADADARSQLQ